MSSSLQASLLGYSHQGRSILLHQLSDGSANPPQSPIHLLVLGGVHGDEPEGIYLIDHLLQMPLPPSLSQQARIWVIPQLNPDGCSLQQRTNAQGVDLNRNMPTQDWSAVARAPRYYPGPAPGSEPETQSLLHCIETLQPHLIISLHAWKPCVNYNGPARQVAEVMAAVNGYAVTSEIGYPTPGSLGTWAGFERQIPTITLEIEEGSSREQVQRQQGKALLAGLAFAADHVNLD